MSARESRKDSPLPNLAAKDGGPGEAASFIAEAVAELVQVSRRHGLDTLGYLLEMAQLEAGEVARQRLKSGGF